MQILFNSHYIVICVFFKFSIFYVISSNVQCPVIKNTFIIFIINFIAFYRYVIFNYNTSFFNYPIDVLWLFHIVFLS